MRYLAILLPCLFLMISCLDLQTGKPFKGVASGNWKGTFVVDDQKIPIIFEVQNTNNKQEPVFIFKNGQTTVKSDRVKIWGDSLFVYFNQSKKQLKLGFEVDKMEGFLFDEDQASYPIKFYGQHAIPNRFPDVRQAPKADLTGTWKVKANSKKDSLMHAQLNIATDNNYAEGELIIADSLRIPLEGTVQREKIYLSGFDGDNVCLLYAQIGSAEALVQGNLLINTQQFFWTGRSVAGVQQE